MPKISTKDTALLGQMLMRCLDDLGKREMKVAIFLAVRRFVGVSLLPPGGVAKLAKAIGEDKANTRQILESLQRKRLCKIEVTPDGWAVAITDWKHIANALDGRAITTEQIQMAVPGGGVVEGTIHAAKKAQHDKGPKPPVPGAAPKIHLSWAFYLKRAAAGDEFYHPYDGKNIKNCGQILDKAAGEEAEARRRLDNLELWAARPGEAFFTVTPGCLLSQWDRLFNPPGERKPAIPSDPYADL